MAEGPLPDARRAVAGGAAAVLGLGWDAVRDVAAGAAAYSARFPGVRFTLVAATNRRFNGTARQQAKVLHVELVEGTDLAELLKQYPTRQGELMSFLLAGWSPL